MTSASSGDCHVEILLNGQELSLTVDGSALSILDAGLDAGYDLPHSCRSGSCGTCLARVLSGRVELQQNQVLTAEEIDAGLTLSCQAIPKSALVMLSYDGLEDR